ncbi:stealth family protein [Natronogracilivirga saccharolytica]|uniref:Stealth CR1 domain-containing protein n=1 Tax=Natronogracilivirga saccharolytica TaxID=2812953 RepID=A0A8J7S6V3_9BACT|nr:stealth family protein [Natronogracilivirga saccharolytica]MBP3193033.1 Stealth CR1 domain-containing protein [Natronogracilivirga saccharolytica]
MADFQEGSQQTDAVITWVDGNDQAHREKREKAEASQCGLSSEPVKTGQDATRFLDNKELVYCINSIRLFAPWIRKIFLVTDNQKPDFLTPELQKTCNLEIVDHKVIFESYEWALPTFNSRTVETALWRIPGLAPRFIYFNDDFFLAGKTVPGHFFTDDGVVLRGSWDKMHSYGPLRMKLNDAGTFFSKKILGITRSMNLLLQIRSARLAGFTDKYFRTPHIPHPIRTETLKKFFETHPRPFEENIRYQFRNTAQFSSVYLAHHLEIASGHAELRDASDFVMLNGEMDFGFTLRRKLRLIRNQDVRFACLHGFESFSRKHREEIRQTLGNHIDGPVSLNGSDRAGAP